MFPPTRRQSGVILLSLLLLGLASKLAVSREFLLLVWPWATGVMLMVLDRKGPVRNWFGSLVCSCFCPLAMVLFNFNGVIAAESARPGWFSLPIVVATVNVLLLVCFASFLVYLSPRRCPGCAKRGLIPLMPLVVRDERSKSTHWCASCDKQFWKKNGVWRPERRRTWWDKARPERSPHTSFLAQRTQRKTPGTALPE